MPLGINELTERLARYTRPVITVDEIRVGLRRLRKQRFRNSREAAKAAALGASTVAKIENTRSFPDYDPGIGTIAKLVTALGCENLSAVFLQFERQTKTDLPPAAAAGSVRGDRENADGTDLALPSPATSMETHLHRVLVDVAHRLLQAADQLRRADEQAPTTRRAEPRRAVGAGRRR